MHHEGFEKKRNDRQVKKVLIVKQIIFTSNKGNVWKSVQRKYMLVATKTRNLFATQLVLKELNGDLVCILPPAKESCLATNHIVASCEQLLEKSRKKFQFMQQSLYTFRVLTAQSKFVLQQVGDATSGVTRDSRVISSNQKAVFTQIAAVFFVEGI